MVLGYHCVARIYCASWRVNPTTNYSVPDRVKPSFVIFDIRAERQSARMSKITNPVWHRMLYSCTHMATVGVKGLTRRVDDVHPGNYNAVVSGSVIHM